MGTVIKRNEKFIYGLRPELAAVTLSHLMDPCDVVVKTTLRNEEMLSNNKPTESQGGQNQKRKFYQKKRA